MASYSSTNIVHQRGNRYIARGAEQTPHTYLQKNTAMPTPAAASAPQANTVTERDLADILYIWSLLIPRVCAVQQCSVERNAMRCKRGRACAYTTLARNSPERKRAMERLRNSARSDGLM